MEIVFEKKTTIKPLRLAYFNQMLLYIEEQENQGWYSGNKEQFNKRHEEIKAWIEDCINTLKK